ncbi:MAG: DMT family transporter [Sulfobacillus thermotolerans]|nr:DMT family transporter [Sulfobacillus thermotolerans]
MRAHLLRTQQYPDLLSLLAMNLIWAGTYPATGLALTAASATFLTMFRLLAGTLVFAPFLFRGRPWTASKIVRTLGLGVIGFSLPLVLQTQGLRASTPAMAAISIALEPLLTALMASLLLKERLPKARKWALALAAVGAWAVAGFPRPGVQGYGMGDGLLVAALGCFAIYNVYSSSLSRMLSPQQATAATFAGGFLGTVPLWLATGAQVPHHWSGPPLWAALYLAVLGTAVAYFLWMLTASRIPMAIMALFLYIQPVLGVVLSAWITPEPMTGSFYLGSAAILLALYLGRDVIPAAPLDEQAM